MNIISLLFVIVFLCLVLVFVLVLLRESNQRKLAFPKPQLNDKTNLVDTGSSSNVGEVGQEKGKPVAYPSNHTRQGL